MGKLSADDEEQLEYIRQWYEMKEEKKRARQVRWFWITQYFKSAVSSLVTCFKLLFGKEE